MRSIILIPLLFASVFVCTQVWAIEASLLSDDVSRFPGVDERLIEQSIMVQGKGSAMRIIYASDREISMQIAFPEMRGEDVIFDPFMSLKVDALPAGTKREVVIDLTGSPAWDASRDRYLLYLRGSEGILAEIEDIDMLPASSSHIIAAVFRQIGVAEPLQLSSINFLHGYRALGVSLALILGIPLLFIGVGLIGMADSKVKHRAILSILLFVFLLYDARFSYDLLTVSAKDVYGWVNRREYRQLGPLHRMIDRLQHEQAESLVPISVALCFALDDIYLKQFRYHLYPIPVDRVGQAHATATHLLFLGEEHALIDGMISCSADESERSAILIEDFGEGSAIYRLTDRAL